MPHLAAAFTCCLMTFHALLVASGVAVEYVTDAMDCNSTSNVVAYNISTLRMCLIQCMLANCFYVKYEGLSCEMNGTDPRPPPNSHMMWKTFIEVGSAEQNIAGLDKPSSQSSNYSISMSSSGSMDGSLSTLSHTNNELNPWWKVDLLKKYYVTKIRFQLRSGVLYRFQSITIYLSDQDAMPAQFSQLPVFASQLTPPTTADFYLTGGSSGMCGRFLVVAETANPGILEMLEIGIFVLGNVQCV